MDKPMICIRCQKEIKSKEHRIEVTEWDNNRLLKQNHMHYNCWEEFMNTKKLIWESLKMAKNLNANLKEQGLIKDEVFI